MIAEFIYNLTIYLLVQNEFGRLFFFKNLRYFSSVSCVVNSLIFHIFVAIEIIKINESKTIYSQ